MRMKGSLSPALGTLFLLLGCNVQLQYESFCFILLYFIFVMFGCSFLMRDTKRVEPERRGRGEFLEGLEGQNCNLDIVYEKKSIFFW